MNLAAIAQKLEGAHRVKDGYRAKCPVHYSESKSVDSLHIWEEDGKIKVHCFGGCTIQQIRDHLGLSSTWQKQIPIEQKSKERITDEIYTDLAESKTLAEILNPKLTPEIITRLLKLKNPAGYEWATDEIAEQLFALAEPGMGQYRIVVNEFFHKSGYSPETKQQIKQMVVRRALIENGTIASRATPSSHYDDDPPADQVYQNHQLMALSGVTVLAGRPKIGKSYLALNLAIAVATGGIFISYFKLDHPGTVLYLALEDHASRMRGRIRALMGDGNASPSNLWLDFMAPTLEEGRLIEEIEEWISVHNIEQLRLVVVDIYGMVQSKRGRKDDIYEHEYGDLRQLNRLATKYNMHILLVTHLNKSYSIVEDVADAVMGSTAITGAVSGIWVMSNRGEERCDAELFFKGKDIPRWSCGLQQINLDGHMDWRALGDIESVIQGDVKIEILTVLYEWDGKPPTQTELRDSLSAKIEKGNFSRMLKKMRADGLIRVDRSRYHLTQAGASSAEIFNNLDNDDNPYNKYNSYNQYDEDVNNQQDREEPWKDYTDDSF